MYLLVIASDGSYDRKTEPTFPHTTAAAALGEQWFL